MPTPPPEARDGAVAPLDSDSGMGGGRGGIGGGMGGWMSPTLGHAMFRADYRVTWYPDEVVRGQATHLNFVRQDLGASWPLWQDDENEWSASASVRNELLNTRAVLPNTGQAFPDELWNVSVGTNFRHLLDDGWMLGGGIHLGSASDQPFHSLNEMALGANLFLRVPQGEHNAWIFSVNFSTNSQVLNYIPIPGIAYFYAPSPWFQATIGFPFANVTYRPTEDLTLQLNYALLTNVRARVTYRVLPMLKVYASFDSGSESYYLEDRTDVRDRFFYNDERVSLGLQWRLTHSASLDLSGGYAFDRYYFEGRNFNNNSQDRVNIGDGPFAIVRIDVRF